MEVEITGTPDPTVTWYKDDEPLIEPEYRMKQQGNCYLLLIDKGMITYSLTIDVNLKSYFILT